jgi:deoxyribose-phosphate aldolase
MKAITPIQESDLEFDNGTFDAAAFTSQTLANWQSLASVIDHALLSPDAMRVQIDQLCDEAARYRFACAMVNPVWASTAVHQLSGTGVPVGAVLGFPFGASLVSTLRQEAASLACLGVRELDMVIPIGLLRSGNHHAVHHAIHSVAAVAHRHGALLKVIFETSLLNMEEKLRAAEIAIQAGADFIQTSTGFNSTGFSAPSSRTMATAADVAVLRGVAGARCGIKAAGGPNTGLGTGVDTLDAVRALLDAGANRIGSSAGVAILRELGAE